MRLRLGSIVRVCVLGRALGVALLAAACTGDIVPSPATSVGRDTDPTRSVDEPSGTNGADQDVPAQPDDSDDGEPADGEGAPIDPSTDAGPTGGDPRVDASTNEPDAESAAPAADVCETALFCDDFEDDAVGKGPASPWKSELNNGAASVDDSKAFRGAHAMHFTVPASSYARAYITLAGAPVFPVPGDAFYGRMMMFLTAAPAGAVHWTNVEAEGNVPNQTYRGLYRYGGMHDDHLLANYETRGTSSDCWQNSDARMPQGRWTCVEWHYDAPNSTMELWLDGQAIGDQTVIERGQGCIANGTGGNWYGPSFDTLRLGWEHYQQTDAKEMWIDDVALGTERLGCPTPP